MRTVAKGATMLRSVLLKTLRDQRRSLLAWATSIVLLVMMYGSFFPSIRHMPSMNDYLNQMPEALRSMFALSGADISTPTGYVQIELLSFMGPILVILYAVSAGNAAVAGEEDRHTMDLLLANPISRTRVVLDKLGAMIIGILLLTTVTGAALLLSGPLFGLTVPAGKATAAMLHLGLLGLVFGALALAIGAATGRTGVSRGVPAVAAVLAYMVNGLAPMVSWLEPFQKFSPFYQYVGHDPLHNGVSGSAVAVSVLTIAGLAVIAIWGFRRRDVLA
jgi:ABC-2 type transport system permease protein